MMNRGIIAIWILLCSGMVFVNASMTVYGEKVTESDIISGVVHIQEDDVTEGEPTISLNGEWEFYSNQLLTPEEINQSSIQPDYIQVPSSWRGQVMNGEPLPHDGYATYRLLFKVHPNDIGKHKAIYMRYVGSAYQIWIDGQPKRGQGVVGKSKDEETPKLQLNLLFFEPSQEFVEVVVQVSNHSFREGGIIGDVTYGNAVDLLPSVLNDLIKDVFLISGLLVIGLYHLIIYITRRKELSILFVGCTGVAIAMRILLLNEYLAFLVLPTDSWEQIVRVEYLMNGVSFVFMILLMKHMYPNEVHRTMFRFSCGFVALYILYIILTPVRLFTETLLLNVAIMAFILLYFVFYVGILAVLRKREGARVNLIVIVVVVTGMCNDTLYYTQMIDTIPVIDYCIMLVILFQAIIISYRYALVMNKNQVLNQELIQTNNTLEEKVRIRTKEIHEKNEELAHLQDVRTKRLANIAHDLGSPMIGIQTYLHLMQEGATANPDFIQQLFGKSNDMKRLVDDLFELSKLESGQLSFELEHLFVNQFIQDVYHKFSPDLIRENMQLHLGRIDTVCKGKEAIIRIDRFRIMQVLQNYIGNAIKFSRSEGAELKINCYILEEKFTNNEGYEIRFEVVDQGIGISPDELPQVFQRFYKKKEGNAGGSGLGLAISKEIIELHGGRVGVESSLGEGSTFYFTLPVVVNTESLHGDS